MTYPTSTGYVKGSATSKASAKQLDDSGNAQSQAARLLIELYGRREHGGTADELTQFMRANGFPAIHNGTVAGRLVHLELNGLIFKTPQTRRTRSNRNATVYVHSEYKSMIDPARIPVVKPPKRDAATVLTERRTKELMVEQLNRSLDVPVWKCEEIAEEILWMLKERAGLL